MNTSSLFFSLSLAITIGILACKPKTDTSVTAKVEAAEEQPAISVTSSFSHQVSDLPQNLLYGEGSGLAKLLEYSYENHVGAWSPSEIILRGQENFSNYVEQNRNQSQCWYIGDSYNPERKLPQWAIIELTAPKTLNYIGILSSEYYSGEGYADRHVKDAQVWVSTTDTEHFEKILPITLHSNEYFEVFKIEPKENVKYIKYLIQSNYGHKETAIAPIVAFYDNTPIKTTKERILAGKTDVYNIFFGLENATLRAESEPMMQELIELLTSNPTKNIEITVHNDSKKDATKNQKLTQERADNIKNKLKAAGIDEKRITAKGAGASQPIASNESEYDRSKNRRVSIELK